MNQGHPPLTIQPRTGKNLPDPIMLARQIDGIREVVLRMRTAQSTAIDTLINQKLQKIAEHQTV